MHHFLSVKLAQNGRETIQSVKVRVHLHKQSNDSERMSRKKFKFFQTFQFRFELMIIFYLERYRGQIYSEGEI